MRAQTVIADARRDPPRPDDTERWGDVFVPLGEMFQADGRLFVARVKRQLARCLGRRQVTRAHGATVLAWASMMSDKPGWSLLHGDVGDERLLSTEQVYEVMCRADPDRWARAHAVVLEKLFVVIEHAEVQQGIAMLRDGCLPRNARMQAELSETIRLSAGRFDPLRTKMRQPYLSLSAALQTLSWMSLGRDPSHARVAATNAVLAARSISVRHVVLDAWKYLGVGVGVGVAQNPGNANKEQRKETMT